MTSIPRLITLGRASRLTQSKGIIYPEDASPITRYDV
ncbi:hypothetical protein E1H18_1759 [Caulobacter sp. RHG1]|nr:hypothetical protein [Caulobacter sp. RHG1]